MLNTLIPQHEMAAKLARLEKAFEDLKALETGGGGQGCKVKTDGSTTLVNNSTWVTFSFGVGSEVWDDLGFHSETVNPTRIAIPTDGRYLLVGNIWAASANGVYLYGRFWKNGATQLAMAETLGAAHLNADDAGLCLVWEDSFVAGDYIEFQGNAYIANIVVAAGQATFSIRSIG